LWVYDSMNGAWFSDSGTSAAAPQWAALVAVADQGRALASQGSLNGASQTLPALYQLARSSPGTYFHDITSGNNGYAATAGYDPVTGLGTPRADALVSALVNLRGSDWAVTFGNAASTGVPGGFQYAATNRLSVALDYGPGGDPAVGAGRPGLVGGQELAPALVSSGKPDAGIVAALTPSTGQRALAEADAPWQVSFAGADAGPPFASPDNATQPGPAPGVSAGEGDASTASDSAVGSGSPAHDGGTAGALWFNLAGGWDGAPTLMDQAAAWAALAVAGVQR
jgi:hypothetical protein